jgi:outer membrane protein OmpA-like peptidoglycan-associated protein
MFRKKTIIHLIGVLALITGPLSSFGQDFLPTLNDNYMGINQVFLQPAAIADSRYRTDFNIAGFSNDIQNDAIRFRSRWILYPTQIVTNKDWWDENTYLSPANGKDKSMYMSQSMIGPSFMFNLDSNGRHTIGFTSRVRSLTNIDDMDEPLFRLIYSNYRESSYYSQWYHDDKMRAMQHIFGDYGLTYAQVIPVTKNPEHFLKAGVTLRLLQGIASSYLQTDNLYYYFNGDAYPSAKQISWNTPYAEAGISDNWGDIDENENYTFSMNYQWTAKPSVGFDIGAVYEFRRDFIRKKVNDSTRIQIHGDRLTRPDLNKYFVKVGVSLLDVGSLTYTKDYYSTDLATAFTPDYLTRYEVGDNSTPANTNWLDASDLKFNYQNYVPFSQEMYNRMENNQGVYKVASNKESFYVKMPAALSLQADLNLFLEGLYVNVTTYWPLKTGFDHAPNSHYIANYSFTPRYERKWFGVSVPVEINRYGKFSVGLGARMGIVYFGVNNLFSNTFSDPYGISAYVGVKVPIYQKDPTRIPKEKEEKIKPGDVKSGPCCPCCCRDKDKLEHMDCLPGYININANHSIININSNNTNNTGTMGNSGPAGAGEGQPSQGPESTPAPDQDAPKDDTQPIKAQHEPCQPTIIHYEFDKSIINGENIRILNEFAGCLLKDPGRKVKITGHTDSSGSEDYNIALSKSRAQSAANYLISKGISPDQLILEWYGEGLPIDDNSTPEGRATNRRVEIEMVE